MIAHIENISVRGQDTRTHAPKSFTYVQNTRLHSSNTRTHILNTFAFFPEQFGAAAHLEAGDDAGIYDISNLLVQLGVFCNLFALIVRTTRDVTCDAPSMKLAATMACLMSYHIISRALPSKLAFRSCLPAIRRRKTLSSDLASEQ